MSANDSLENVHEEPGSAGMRRLPSRSRSSPWPRPRKKPKPRKDQAAEAQGPQADYSKEFRKLGAPVQALVNEKKWAEVIAALPRSTPFRRLPATT